MAKSVVKSAVVDVEEFVGIERKAIHFELSGEVTPRDVAKEVLRRCGDEYTEAMPIRVGLHNATGALVGWYRGNIMVGEGNPWFKVTEQKDAGVYTSVRYMLDSCTR